MLCPSRVYVLSYFVITERAAKAAKVYPRPPGKLRPVVHSQTQKYNVKMRAGKGFTLDELRVSESTEI